MFLTSVVTGLLFAGILHHFIIVSDGVWIKDGITFRLSRFFYINTHGWLRPITLMYFYAMYPIAGLHYVWYYGVNIVLHFVNAVVIYFIVVSLCGNGFPRAKDAAFLSALFFAVLFPHYEAVIVLCTIHDILMTFFCLLSFWIFARTFEKKNIPLHILSAVSFVLGLLCKETALFFPFVLLVYVFLFSKELTPRDKMMKSIQSTLPHFLVLLVYSAYYIGVVLPEQNKYVARFVIPSLREQMMLNADSLADLFLSSVGWVRDAYFHYYGSLYPSLELIFLGSRLILWLSLCFILLYMLVKKFSFGHQKRMPVIAFFCVSWMVFNFFPSTFSVEATLRDFILFPRFRYFYMPSVGLAMLFGTGIVFVYEKFSETSKTFKMFVYVFIASFLISNMASTRIMVGGYGNLKQNYKKLVFTVGSACKGKCGEKTIYLINLPDGYKNFYAEGLKQAVDLHFKGNVSLAWVSGEKLLSMPSEEIDEKRGIFIELLQNDKTLYDRTFYYRDMLRKKFKNSP